MNVGQLKKDLENIDDNRVVIFEYVENGKPADTSYGINQVEDRFDTFCMLISVD